MAYISNRVMLNTAVQGWLKQHVPGVTRGVVLAATPSTINKKIRRVSAKGKECSYTYVLKRWLWNLQIHGRHRSNNSSRNRGPKHLTLVQLARKPTHAGNIKVEKLYVVPLKAVGNRSNLVLWESMRPDRPSRGFLSPYDVTHRIPASDIGRPRRLRVSA